MHTNFTSGEMRKYVLNNGNDESNFDTVPECWMTMYLQDKRTRCASSIGMQGAERDKMLRAHNDYRKKARASDMKELVSDRAELSYA